MGETTETLGGSSQRPALSVVVGASAPAASLEACLRALQPQVEGVEVLVCEGIPSPSGLHERFPWARFIERPGALVPELWRDGIDESRGEIVALTIAQMIPAPDWIAAIRAQHQQFEGVGGAIDPGPRLGAADWAEFFCRYARDMLPFAGHACADLPGDNAAYSRRVLELTRDLYRDGFWEPVVHRKLVAEGVALWHAPEVVVHQGRSSGWLAFVRQRLHHGRAYGRQRGAEFGRARTAVGLAAAPAVPFLVTVRVLREVWSRRRYRGRVVAVLPILFSFNLAWGVAEARGYLDVLRSR